MKHRKNPKLCEELYGEFWRNPKLLFGTEHIELIYPPPERILTRADMRDYQLWMTTAILTHPGVFLGAEMGLGKTGATLSAICTLLERGEVTKILIVAPLRVAENTWPEEIATWDFARDLDYAVITGDEDERIAALKLNATVDIVNRENVPWLKRYLGTRGWKYDMLAYDEASRLKAGEEKTASERRSEFGVLAQMRFRFKKVVLLSGTPSTNGLIDLWGPMFICDEGEALGRTKTSYTQRWFHYDHYKRVHIPHKHSEKEIMHRLKGKFYSLREADHLKLPPLIERDHVVDMPTKAMNVYRQMVNDMAIEELNLEAVNNGVLSNKLLQIANGSVYDSDQEEIWLHDAKIDALDSINAESMGRPLLVGYSYQHDVRKLKRRFPFLRVFGEGKNDVRDWNAGRIRMMILHPASAGHGLNFQFGSNIAVWFGLPWSLELYQQFNKRLHRSGQKEDRVFLHRILARGTVDFNVLKALKSKRATQDRITDAVRVHVEEIQRYKRAA